MNERILELRKQAMVREAYYPAGNDGHPEYRSYLSEEKFAELIIRECIGIVARRKNQSIDDGWNVDEAMTMAEMDLVEHFGDSE